MIKFLALLNIIRFWPHLLIFLFQKKGGKMDQDLEAYCKQYKLSGSRAFRFLYLFFTHKGFRNLFYFRIGNASHLISWLGHGCSNFHISKTTDVAGGILLFHPFGTLIDCAQIGKGCRITHNVTVAIKNGKYATLGENVILNPNCLLIGEVTIGNNCTIGPGAVVFKDIPENCVVVGNPAMILKQDGVVIKKML